jgi:hypothetical protein
MPNIIRTHTYPDGQMIGWDTEANQGKGGWVEIDRIIETVKDLLFGKVGRSASRGMQEKLTPVKARKNSPTLH